MKNKTLNDWLNIIGKIHGQKIDLGLTRVQAVASKMQLLHFNCPIITVAGTNGKGSTVATLEALAIEHQLNVGALTSPDLIRYNERIKLNGIEASDQAICEAFEAIEAARGETTLTFFEFNVLAALYIFKKTPLNLIILEVGLGGRLDATNILDATVSVITSIDLDHQEFLGDTRDKIAREKAGIFRQNKPAIIGDPNPPTVLQQITQTLNCDTAYYLKDFQVCEHKQSWDYICQAFTLTDLPYKALSTQNIGIAITAFYQYLKKPLTTENVCKALKRICLAGRFEVNREATRCVIYDVAHNPAAAKLLSENLEKHYPKQKFQAIFSILNNKDLIGTLSPLLKQVAHWHVATLNSDRATDLAHLQTIFHQLKIENVTFYDSMAQASQSLFSSQDKILVFGSFCTVAEVKAVIPS